MGRASASGVDAMITVVEPGMRSVQTAARIQKLAQDIGVPRTFVVVNRLRHEQDRDPIQRALQGQVILGTLPFREELIRADLEGRPVDAQEGPFREAVTQVWEALESQLGTTNLDANEQTTTVGGGRPATAGTNDPPPATTRE
jgi:CO dehydrogenase maturation factor